MCIRDRKTTSGSSAGKPMSIRNSSWAVVFLYSLEFYSPRLDVSPRWLRPRISSVVVHLLLLRCSNDLHLVSVVVSLLGCVVPSSSDNYGLLINFYKQNLVQDSLDYGCCLHLILIRLEFTLIIIILILIRELLDPLSSVGQ